MAFTLYNAPQSTCSQRVRFVLNTKALPFTDIRLNLLEGDQLKPDYLKKNPNGVVPPLDHAGAIGARADVQSRILADFSENEPRRLHCHGGVQAAASRVHDDHGPDRLSHGRDGRGARPLAPVL